MLTLEEFNEELSLSAKGFQRRAQALVGRKVEITDEYFTGSRKSQLGRVFTITSVRTDGGQVTVLLDHPSYGRGRPWVSSRSFKLLGNQAVVPPKENRDAT